MNAIAKIKKQINTRLKNAFTEDGWPDPYQIGPGSVLYHQHFWMHKDGQDVGVGIAVSPDRIALIVHPAPGQQTAVVRMTRPQDFKSVPGVAVEEGFDQYTPRVDLTSTNGQPLPKRIFVPFK